MKTILITAYAINPYKGSEDGTGWNLARVIAEKNKVILLTRCNNIAHLDKYWSENDYEYLKNIQYFGFDLPKIFMTLKKRIGERGYVLYFYLWQLRIVDFIRSNKWQFDIAHSLNFHSDSVPTFLWKLGKPTVWGPIGHHPMVPKGFVLRTYSVKSAVKDVFYNIVKSVLRKFDGNFIKALERVDRIIVINSMVLHKFSTHRDKIQVMPAVGDTSADCNCNRKEQNDIFRVLSVGRFHYLKGFDLTLRAFAVFMNSIPLAKRHQIKLCLLGKGEELQTLKNLSDRLGISEYIEWKSWIKKADMEEIYACSSVFLFPSHEGAGMVIPEAMNHCLPVVCIDNVGPGELIGNAGLKVSYDGYDKVVEELGIALTRIYLDDALKIDLAERGKIRFEEQFTWSEKCRRLNEIYSEL